MPLKGGLKTQNGLFPSIIALHLKKACYNVSLYEYCQGQSREAFTGIFVYGKMIGGGRPLAFTRKFGG